MTNKRIEKKIAKRRFEDTFNSVVLDHEVEITQTDGTKSPIRIGDFYQYAINYSNAPQAQGRVHYDILEILNIYKIRNGADSYIELSVKRHNSDDGHTARGTGRFDTLVYMLDEYIYETFTKVNYTPVEYQLPEHER